MEVGEESKGEDGAARKRKNRVAGGLERVRSQQSQKKTQTFLLCDRATIGDAGEQGNVVALPGQMRDCLLRRRGTVRIVAGAITRQWQLERRSQVLVPCAGTTTGFDNMVPLTDTALQMWFYLFDWRLCALIIFI